MDFYGISMDISSPYSTEEDVPFAPSRSTFSDFFHGLWAGTGETLDIFGRGTGIDTLSDMGQSVSETQYAKPDLQEYLGTQSQTSKIVTGMGQGLPLSAAFMAGGIGGAAAGSLAGPVGTVAGGVAGTTAVGAAFARGLYDKTVDEMIQTQPDMSLDEIESYAKKSVAIETLTEMADAGVSLVAGKVAGKLTGTGLRTALSNGLLSVDDVISASAKRIGARQFAAAAFGDAALSGGSEVVADKLQYELDQSYDIESEAPDYFTTFMIGALISTPFGAGSALVEKRSQDKIRSNIAKGLSSDDVTQRMYMANQVSENLKKASPEAADIWDRYVEYNVKEGPLDINDPALQITTKQLDQQEWQKNLDTISKDRIYENLRKVSVPLYTDIVTKPEEILKTAGIPSGTATSSPYGKGIAPPGVSSETSPVVASPVEPQWKKDLKLSLKEQNALMDTEVTAYQETGAAPKTKASTIVPQTEAVAAEPTRPAAQQTAQWKKWIYDNPKRIEEAMAEMPEDSNTITVEQQQAAQQKAVDTRVSELKGKEKLTLAEKKEFQDLTGEKYAKAATKKATAPTVVVEAKAAPVPKAQKVKVEKLEKQAVALQEDAADATLPTEQRVAAKKQLEEVQAETAALKTDDTVVTPGTATQVDKAGNLTRVIYDPAGWKQPKEKVAVYTNGNAIVYRKGKDWLLAQKDEEGGKIKQPGRYSSLKQAKEALAEGKLPSEVNPIEEVVETKAAPLTLSQKKLVTDIDTKKLAKQVLGTLRQSDNPDLEGVATEAIVSAARTYDPTSDVKFETYAFSKAKGAVRNEVAKQAKEGLMQDTTTEVAEGSERTSKVNSATAVDVQEVYEGGQDEGARRAKAKKGEGKKVEKEEAPPVTKISVEQYQKEQEAKAKKGKVEPTEANVIRRTPAASFTEVNKDATSILERVGWEKAKATALAENIVNENHRARVLKEIDKLTKDTTSGILNRYINSAESSKASKGLANFLKKILSDNPDKLASLKIRVDENVPSPNYDPNTHTVTLWESQSAVDTTALHEIAHAITVRELYSNPKLRQEVLDLMKLAEQEAVSVGLVTQENLDRMKALRIRTGQEFKREFNNETLPAGERTVLYALNNEFEFMAQAFNNKGFLQFLSTIPVPENYQKTPTSLKSAIKTLYDAIIDIISRIFSSPTRTVSDSAMKRLLELFTELSGQDVRNWETGSRTYGVDVLEADITKQKKTNEERYQIMKELEVSLKDSPVAWVKKQATDVKDLIKDYAQSTTNRLARISQPISNALRKMEFRISRKNEAYSKEIKPFIDKYDKLSQKDRLLLDLALMNADGTNEYTKTRDDILSNNNMTEDYERVKKVLAEIHQRKEAQGLNKYGDLPEYFPRKVKDMDALRQTMKNDGSYGVIEAAIDRENMSTADKELAITSMINTGRMPPIAFKTPSSSKERSIAVVKSDWKHHYMSSSEVLVNHIYENNEAIEARAMFGSAKRKEKAELRDKLYKVLEAKRPDSKGYSNTVKKIVELEAWLERNPEEEYFEGISEYLTKNAIDLTPKEQSDIIKLLRGRLTQAGMTGVWAAVRNLSLMSVLGNPLSAVTQLGDTVFSVNDAGVENSLKAAFGEKMVSAKDLDLVHSLREFQSGKTAGWLDWALRWSSMTAMDKFGKELYMNAIINKTKKMSLTDFTNKWGKYLENETESTYNDIKAGKKTEAVMFFAFNALSEVQPITMSEMPMKYLTARNGRMFYALKSYNIRLLNNLYQRFAYNFKDAKTKQEKLRALGDASKLLALVVLAGASTDELKDFIQGKDVTNFSDRLTDNLLRITLVNKYALTKAERDGFFSAIASGILMPPLQLGNDPIKDLKNLIDPEKEMSFYTLRNVPLGGKLGYSWLTDTSKKSTYWNLKTNILEDYKDNRSIGRIKKDMNRYNRWARGNKEPIITYSTLRNTLKKK